MIIGPLGQGITHVNGLEDKVNVDDISTRRRRHESFKCAREERVERRPDSFNKR